MISFPFMVIARAPRKTAAPRGVSRVAATEILTVLRRLCDRLGIPGILVGDRHGGGGDDEDERCEQCEKGADPGHGSSSASEGTNLEPGPVK